MNNVQNNFGINMFLMHYLQIKNNQHCTKEVHFIQIVEDSAKRQKDGNIDDTAKLFSELQTKWDPKKYLTSSVQKEQQDRKSLTPALESYQKWSSSNPNEIVALELPFTTYIGGFKVNGVIDRLEKTPEGEYVVIDYKTGGKEEKS